MPCRYERDTADIWERIYARGKTIGKRQLDKLDCEDNRIIDKYNNGMHRTTGA